MIEPKKILQQHLGSSLKLVEPLASYTTLEIGGPADFFFEAKTIDDLVKGAAAAKEAKLPFTVLGSGAAVLVSDVGYHGLVIRNLYEGIKEGATDNPIKFQVEVGSGTSLGKLVRFSIENGLSGLEGLAGLSGTIGGAITFNAGTHAEKISDSLDSVRIVDIIGQLRTAPKSDLQFGDDSSRFLGREEIILSAKFNLLKSDPGTIQQKINLAVAKLSDRPKDPRSIQAFRYLAGESPERLIKAVGLAGHKVGGAALLESNPNFIQNLGHATAENIVELVSLAKSKVKEKYYTDLEEAFLYLGPF